LVINNLYPPYIVGGNEILARDVVEELRRRGHEVHVVTGRGAQLPVDAFTHGALDLDLDHKEDTFLGRQQPDTLQMITWHLFNPRSYAAARRLIRQINPDLVIIWNLYLASMSPLVAAMRSGKPTTVHVADKWLYYGLKRVTALVRPPRRAQRLIMRTLERFFQPALSAFLGPLIIVAISEFMRSFYLSHGFASADIAVIHLGVPTRVFTPQARRDVPADHYRLLFVGALWEGKGPHVAVRALGALRRRGFTNLALDVYGNGTENFLSWLRAVISEEGVGHAVALHGYATREEIAAAYQTHDLLVFPSIWDEPFAAVPIEAMSCGMAIVATTAGGTPEAIRNGETGLLVPPDDPNALADAICRLVHEPALRRRLGEQAARIARSQFDFARYVDQLEAHYETRVREARGIAAR
jgi:glycosyltransferase involved in cell wall biosynthesis